MFLIKRRIHLFSLDSSMDKRWPLAAACFVSDTRRPVKGEKLGNTKKADEYEEEASGQNLWRRGIMASLKEKSRWILQTKKCAVRVGRQAAAPSSGPVDHPQFGATCCQFTCGLDLVRTCCVHVNFQLIVGCDAKFVSVTWPEPVNRFQCCDWWIIVQSCIRVICIDSTSHRVEVRTPTPSKKFSPSFHRKMRNCCEHTQTAEVARNTQTSKKKKRESQFDKERKTRVGEETGNEAGGKFIDYSPKEQEEKQWTSLFPAPSGPSISGHLLHSPAIHWRAHPFKMIRLFPNCCSSADFKERT